MFSSNEDTPSSSACSRFFENHWFYISSGIYSISLFIFDIIAFASLTISGFEICVLSYDHTANENNYDMQETNLVIVDFVLNALSTFAGYATHILAAVLLLFYSNNSESIQRFLSDITLMGILFLCDFNGRYSITDRGINNWNILF